MKQNTVAQREVPMLLNAVSHSDCSNRECRGTHPPLTPMNCRFFLVEGEADFLFMMDRGAAWAETVGQTDREGQ